MKAKSQSTYTALSQGKYKSIDFHWMSHNRGFPYKDMEVMTKKKKKKSHSGISYGSRGLEVNHPGQLTLSDQKDVPHHMALCLGIKTGEKEEEGK